MTTGADGSVPELEAKIWGVVEAIGPGEAWRRLRVELEPGHGTDPREAVVEAERRFRALVPTAIRLRETARRDETRANERAAADAEGALHDAAVGLLEAIVRLHYGDCPDGSVWGRSCCPPAAVRLGDRIYVAASEDVDASLAVLADTWDDMRGFGSESRRMRLHILGVAQLADLSGQDY